jgi:hypothetical protein
MPIVIIGMLRRIPAAWLATESNVKDTVVWRSPTGFRCALSSWKLSAPVKMDFNQIHSYRRSGRIALPWIVPVGG